MRSRSGHPIPDETDFEIYKEKEYKYDYVDNNFNIVDNSNTIIAYIPVEGYVTYLGDILRGHYE